MSWPRPSARGGVFLTCLTSGGQVSWRRLLATPELEVLGGTLRADGERLIVEADGEHSRGATEYGWTFTVTEMGDVLKKAVLKPGDASSSG